MTMRLVYDISAASVFFWLRVSAVILSGALMTVTAAAPAGAEDFYAGKTIDLVVGNPPGGGFDIYARTLAQHMSRHIPGSPTMVVKNMPGAGGARAGHYVSAVAKKDGLAIGAIMPGTIMAPRSMKSRTRPSIPHARSISAPPIPEPTSA
jgi:tripartite-type tricarboxylate transporter receptor subunit TctC